MKLKEKEELQNIFKTQVFGEKSIDYFIEDAYNSIISDDKKVAKLIDELVSIIENKMNSNEDENWEATISFLAPVLAELFKSSADFKKQKTDLINSMHKFVSTKQRENKGGEGFSLADIWADISKRSKDE